jgi:menaquinol-cytochrome c reductase iron-sulfur subunit
VNNENRADSDGVLGMLSRRTLLSLLSTAVGALAACLVAVPVLGSLLSPLLLRARQVWRPVGRVEHFKVGDTVAVRFDNSAPLPWGGIAALTAAWLRRDSEGEFTAFSLNCTHLGCPVRWLPEAELFMCPCHGGVYYSDGRVASGPPPQALTRYPVRVRNGRVEIQTSPVPIT